MGIYIYIAYKYCDICHDMCYTCLFLKPFDVYHGMMGKGLF